MDSNIVREIAEMQKYADILEYSIIGMYQMTKGVNVLIPKTDSAIINSYLDRICQFIKENRNKDDKENK